MKLQWQELAARLTGISTPIGGLQWQPGKSEQEACRRLMLFLEDRRVLYFPEEAEVPHHCLLSIEKIRTECTQILSDCPQGSLIEDVVRHIRSACRDFMSANNSGQFATLSMLATLGDLRTRIGIQIARLSAGYEIDIDGPLAIIAPPTVEDWP